MCAYSCVGVSVGVGAGVCVGVDVDVDADEHVGVGVPPCHTAAYVPHLFLLQKSPIKETIFCKTRACPYVTLPHAYVPHKCRRVWVSISA